MKPVSDKRMRRIKEVRQFRLDLIAKVGKCEVCGHSEKKPNRNLPSDCSKLAVHEIANGPDRAKALDQEYAILVLCYACNQEMCSKHVWPQSRQLAVLRTRRPSDYDLVAFNHLVNPNAPNRITEQEVEEHYRKDAAWLNHS